MAVPRQRARSTVVSTYRSDATNRVCRPAPRTGAPSPGQPAQVGAAATGGGGRSGNTDVVSAPLSTREVAVAPAAEANVSRIILSTTNSSSFFIVCQYLGWPTKGPTAQRDQPASLSASDTHCTRNLSDCGVIRFRLRWAPARPENLKRMAPRTGGFANLFRRASASSIRGSSTGL